MSKKNSPSSNPFVNFDYSKPDLRKKEEPLISVRVTNPITYLKSWWKRVMSREGVDFHFKIKPLTAIAMTIVIATFGFGVGKFTLVKQKPFIQYVPSTVEPTPDPWRDTAFSGTLRYSKLEAKFYLLTNSAEAIKIDVLDKVNLKKLIGRRIFATGRYNKETNTLVVNDVADMELLPKKVEAIPLEPKATVLPTPKSQASDEATLD